MRSAPSVSVIIPVYNAGAFMAPAVTSVLRQELTDFELLLLDDCSTDGTLALARSFTDPRVRVLAQPNRGPAAARNTGLRHARAPFVAFLDAHDWWAPEKLARHVAHLRANPNVGLSFSHSLLATRDGRHTGKAQRSLEGAVAPEALLLENPIGSASAVVMRRAALDAIAFTSDRRGYKEVAYFDEDLRTAEDLDCWWRLALLTGWTLACLPEPLTTHRQHDGGLSADTALMRDGWERAFAKEQGYAPLAVSALEHAARARTLRRLADRAVADRDGTAAGALLSGALRAYPALALQQPRQTLLIAAAAATLRLTSRRRAAADTPAT
jgi:glycosyltransferase involved in cell wall biosynthesis